MEANIVTKGEKKAEMERLENAFFASIFNREMGYPLGNWPCELVNKDGEQNRHPAMQRKQLVTCCAP